MEKYYCALCNKEFVLEEDYGGCSVCSWMHDPVQEDDPNYRGGANKANLNEARAKWQRQNTNADIGTGELVAAVV